MFKKMLAIVVFVVISMNVCIGSMKASNDDVVITFKDRFWVNDDKLGGYYEESKANFNIPGLCVNINGFIDGRDGKAYIFGERETISAVLSSIFDEISVVRKYDEIIEVKGNDGKTIIYQAFSSRPEKGRYVDNFKIPLRSLFETLGYEVIWNEDKSIKIVKNIKN